MKQLLPRRPPSRIVLQIDLEDYLRAVTAAEVLGVTVGTVLAPVIDSELEKLAAASEPVGTIH